MNYFYDLSDEINKKLNKKIKLGFAMFRDCKDINEAIDGCKKALEYAKNNNQVNTLEEIDTLKQKTIDTQTIENMFEMIENKVQEVEYSLSQEENFDIPLIEVRFIEILKTKINTFKRKGFTKSPQAISFKNYVLFSHECLLESLAKALNVKNENLNAKLNFLIRYYRNHPDENKRLIWFVNVDKGFYYSTYLLRFDEKQDEVFFCVPFDGKRAFGMSMSELSVHKDNSGLRNCSVKPYVKKEKK